MFGCLSRMGDLKAIGVGNVDDQFYEDERRDSLDELRIVDILRCVLGQIFDRCPAPMTPTSNSTMFDSKERPNCEVWQYARRLVRYGCSMSAMLCTLFHLNKMHPFGLLWEQSLAHQQICHQTCPKSPPSATSVSSPTTATTADTNNVQTLAPQMMERSVAAAVNAQTLAPQMEQEQSTIPTIGHSQSTVGHTERNAIPTTTTTTTTPTKIGTVVNESGDGKWGEVLFPVTALNVHRLMLGLALLHVKNFDDQYYNNSYWAKIGGITLKEMNEIEQELLKLFGWCLYINPSEFAEFFVLLMTLGCHDRNVSTTIYNFNLALNRKDIQAEIFSELAARTDHECLVVHAKLESLCKDAQQAQLAADHQFATQCYQGKSAIVGMQIDANNTDPYKSNYEQKYLVKESLKHLEQCQCEPAKIARERFIKAKAFIDTAETTRQLAVKVHSARDQCLKSNHSATNNLENKNVVANYGQEPDDRGLMRMVRPYSLECNCFNLDILYTILRYIYGLQSSCAPRQISWPTFVPVKRPLVTKSTPTLPVFESKLPLAMPKPTATRHAAIRSSEKENVTVPIHSKLETAPTKIPIPIPDTHSSAPEPNPIGTIPIVDAIHSIEPKIGAFPSKVSEMSQKSEMTPTTAAATLPRTESQTTVPVRNNDSEKSQKCWENATATSTATLSNISQIRISDNCKEMNTSVGVSGVDALGSCVVELTLNPRKRRNTELSASAASSSGGLSLRDLADDFNKRRNIRRKIDNGVSNDLPIATYAPFNYQPPAEKVAETKLPRVRLETNRYGTNQSKKTADDRRTNLFPIVYGACALATDHVPTHIYTSVEPAF